MLLNQNLNYSGTNKIVHYIKIAGCVFQITSYINEDQLALENFFIERIKQLYIGFILVNKPEIIDFEINIYPTSSYDFMLNKRSKHFFMGISQRASEREVITNYNISDIQFQIILRGLCQEYLSKKKGFLMHGSSVEVKNKANIFLGESGAGKSTIMSMLSNEYAPLGDDSFFIKREKGNFVFYSTPTKEKNSWFAKSCYPHLIGNIFLLKKGKKHLIKKIKDKKTIFNEILQQLYVDKTTMNKQLKYLVSFINDFDNFYSLEFSLKNEHELIKIINNFQIK
jgi:hypothetical protein